MCPTAWLLGRTLRASVALSLRASRSRTTVQRNISARPKLFPAYQTHTHSTSKWLAHKDILPLFISLRVDKR